MSRVSGDILELEWSDCRPPSRQCQRERKAPRILRCRRDFIRSSLPLQLELSSGLRQSQTDRQGAAAAAAMKTNFSLADELNKVKHKQEKKPERASSRASKRKLEETTTAAANRSGVQPLTTTTLVQHKCERTTGYK